MANNRINSFAETLLNWHATIDRNLPWKSTDDPYKIWLSEVIMQQTRVAQGTPYYLKFVEAFPTAIDLANADESQVMKLWQGLGYYSRARNLHFAAKTIRDDFDGTFPTEYKDILALKGIGKYTAAAISSFAYGYEYPVVDGNVIRLISRYFGITAAVDTAQTLNEINDLAVKLIKGSNPAEYNQAIMDFGALMCAPKSPNCAECPLNINCVAYSTDQVNTIPYKSKKIKKKVRYFHYFQIEDSDGNIIINHRTKKDIWQSLFDFPSIENNKETVLNKSEIQDFLQDKIGDKASEISNPSKIYKHILTHQTLYGQFYSITIEHFPKNIIDYQIIEKSALDSYALPVLITNYLTEQKEWTLF